MEQPTSQPSPAKRFFKGVCIFIKCLWVLLLAVLLIAGIYFQTPWKVLTLIAIFLAAATILPKRYRKYFRLTVTCVVIALAVWVFLPEDDSEQWQLYTLTEEIEAYREKCAVPDNQNAAIILDQLLEDYDGERYVNPDFNLLLAREIKDVNMAEFTERFWPEKPKNTFYPDSWNDELDDLTLYKPWSSNKYPELAQWIEQKHKTTVEKLFQASTKNYCRFIPDFDIVSEKKLTRTIAHREWNRLLIRAANNDRGDGRTDQALQKYNVVLKLLKLHAQDPSYSICATDYSVLMALANFIMDSQLSEKQLVYLCKVITDTEISWSDYWSRELDYTKQTTKTILVQTYQINPEGKIRFSRFTGPNKIQKSLNIDVPETRVKTVAKKIASIIMWFYFPADPAEICDMIDHEYEKLWDMTSPDYNWHKEPEFFSFKLNFRFMIKTFTKMTRKLAHAKKNGIVDRYIILRHGNLILIDLSHFKKENGSWPQSLDDIKTEDNANLFIGPVNNDSFVYKLTGDSFILYNKGQNGIDDGGVRDHRTQKDDIMIWPLESRQTEETEERG